MSASQNIKVYGEDGKLITSETVNLQDNKMYYFSKKKGGSTTQVVESLESLGERNGAEVIGPELPSTDSGSRYEKSNDPQPENESNTDTQKVEPTTEPENQPETPQEEKPKIGFILTVIRVAGNNSASTSHLVNTIESINGSTMAVIRGSARQNPDGKVPDEVIQNLPSALIDALVGAFLTDLSNGTINSDTLDKAFWFYKEVRPVVTTPRIFSIQDLKFKHQ